MNPPQAPDPYKTADAQTASNKQTAITQQELGQTNQTNPYGSLTYSQTGTNPDGTPKSTATTTLNPQTQALFDQYLGLQGSSGKAAQGLIDSGAGALGGKGLDLSYDGTASSLDALNRARLDPQWSQNTNMQESKLANQGLTPGMPGYDNAMRVFNQGKNDAYNSANLADYQTATNAKLQEYQAPLQAFNTLKTGAQPQMPQFMNTPAPNVAGTNVAGLVSDNYKNQLAQYNAQMGGMFGLAGTAAGAALGGPLGAGLGGALSGSLGGMFGGNADGGTAGSPVAGLTMSDYGPGASLANRYGYA